MTNEQIINLYEGLYELGQDPEIKLKATTCFSLAKNKNLLRPFYDSAIEARQKLIEKYGEPSDDGSWFVPNEKLSNFKTEFESLMKMDTYIVTDDITIQNLENEKIGLELMEKLLPIIKKT